MSHAGGFPAQGAWALTLRTSLRDRFRKGQCNKPGYTKWGELIYDKKEYSKPFNPKSPPKSTVAAMKASNKKKIGFGLGGGKRPTKNQIRKKGIRGKRVRKASPERKKKIKAARSMAKKKQRQQQHAKKMRAIEKGQKHRK